MKSIHKMFNLSTDYSDPFADSKYRARRSGTGSLLMIITCSWLTLIQTSCKKFLAVPSPETSTDASIAYGTDGNAAAIVTGIYASISNGPFTSFGITSLSLFPALSADELTLYDLTNSTYLPYYQNSLKAETANGSNFWSQIYPILFVTNDAIAGLLNSTTLTPSIKQQLLGEAKFVRAFCYFYLVNLYGDVPLALTTDYQVNRQLTRAPVAQVYLQIIKDLNDAESLLNSNYLAGDIKTITVERTSPNKWAATALLARVYLYTGQWDSAEAYATATINNVSLYSLDTLNGVFLKNSMEAIWQLQPVLNNPSNTQDARLFILDTLGPDASSYPVYLSNNVINSFEANDLRKVNWVDSVVVNNLTYYFPYKYKDDGMSSNVTEYLMVLRLGEQYLIRAEARAELGKIMGPFGAVSDLDVIRERAGLPDYSGSIDSASVLAAILHERQVEFFTEWGHRWFDLKRTGNINSVMGAPGNSCINKGGKWNPNSALYPIPLLEIQRNPNLVGHQNPGY